MAAVFVFKKMLFLFVCFFVLFFAVKCLSHKILRREGPRPGLEGRVSAQPLVSVIFYDYIREVPASKSLFNNTFPIKVSFE